MFYFSSTYEYAPELNSFNSFALAVRRVLFFSSACKHWTVAFAIRSKETKDSNKIIGVVALLRHVWHWYNLFYFATILGSSLRTDQFDEIMSVLSKCFNHVLSNVNCHEIVHPHTSSCTYSAWISFWKPVPTTAKFFLPFFLVTDFWVVSKWTILIVIISFERFRWHPNAIKSMDWRAEKWLSPSRTPFLQRFSPGLLDDGSCAFCSRFL